MKLELQNVTHVCTPELLQYGSMTEGIQQFSYTFHSGMSYGLKAECGDGAWGISYVLAGKTRISDGRILLNGRDIDDKSLHQISCYVGDFYKSRFSWMNKTVKQQLVTALSKNDKVSYQQVVDAFELSESRLNRKLWEVSNEKWNAVAAIGLASNKRIFCFPWFNETWTVSLHSRLSVISDRLRETGAIVLFPLGNDEIVKDILDKTIIIKQGSVQY